jgi:hypothetical protein
MGDFAYAFARICARYGARPDDAAWRRLEHAREFATLLDVARASAFHSWTRGVEATSTPHRIESLMRERWRETVRDVASWMPEAWRPAIRWCAVAADLPALQHVARGHDPMQWLRDDAVWRDFVAEPAERTASEFGALAPAWADPDGVGDVWRREWLRRLPSVARNDAALASLDRAVAATLSALREPSRAGSAALVHQLQTRLALLFRQAVASPAAAFVYLAQVALDLQRLRGELLRRAAFPGLSPAA